MKPTARTFVGVLLLTAAGFGIAWLLMKNDNRAPTEKAPRAALNTEPAATATAATKPRRHRAKHPRRGSTPPVEDAKAR